MQNLLINKVSGIQAVLHGIQMRYSAGQHLPASSEQAACLEGDGDSGLASVICQFNFQVFSGFLVLGNPETLKPRNLVSVNYKLWYSTVNIKGAPGLKKGSIFFPLDFGGD